MQTWVGQRNAPTRETIALLNAQWTLLAALLVAHQLGPFILLRKRY